MIGELPGVPGLFVGAFPFMGFTAGPLLGRTLAELAMGRTVGADVASFAP
jgi:sarcosine oxidase subunit beta